LFTSSIGDKWIKVPLAYELVQRDKTVKLTGADFPIPSVWDSKKDTGFGIPCEWCVMPDKDDPSTWPIPPTSTTPTKRAREEEEDEEITFILPSPKK